MRVGGLTATTALLKAYDGAAWKNLLGDPRGVLQLLNVPWPLYLAPGRLIFYDDMEGVLKWHQLEGTVTRDNSIHVFDGDYCLKILTGIVAGNWANAARVISFPGRGKFRFMCHWHPWGEAAEPPQADLRELQIELTLTDGEYRQKPTIRYLCFEDAVETRKWQYLNAAGAWADIPGASQYIHGGTNEWPYAGDNFLALDFDISDGSMKIDRFVSNNLDLKNLDLTGYQEALTITPGLSMRFGVQANLDQGIAVYFDDIALGDTVLP